MRRPNLSPGTSRRDLSAELLAAGRRRGDCRQPGADRPRRPMPSAATRSRSASSAAAAAARGACSQAMNTSGGEVKLVAMADAFADRLQVGYRGINRPAPKQGRCAQGSAVRRPQCLQGAAADRLRHGHSGHAARLSPAALRGGGRRPASTIFAEKPVAVDAAGVRKFLAANEEAKKKGLAVAIGLQRRHERKYMETVKAIQDGAIGDIVLARAYWNGTQAVVQGPRRTARPKWSTRCATGTTSTGSAAITSSSSTFTTSTSSTGSRTTIPSTAQGQGGCTLRAEGLRRNLRPSLRRVHLRRRHGDAQPVPPSARHLALRVASTSTAPRAMPTSAARRSTTPTAR